jgi:F-type H+-transporting ATPase subunit c
LEVAALVLAISDVAFKYIGAGVAIGLGGLAPALAIGMLTGKAMEALGRNPEAQPVIQTNMILGIAFAEAIAIYALVVAVMIGFVF